MNSLVVDSENWSPWVGKAKLELGGNVGFLVRWPFLHAIFFQENSVKFKNFQVQEENLP